MKKMMRALLMFLVVTTFSTAAGAAEWLSGYVVMPNNDTIKCKINRK
jgi:hypothetical protein